MSLSSVIQVDPFRGLRQDDAAQYLRDVIVLLTAPKLNSGFETSGNSSGSGSNSGGGSNSGSSINSACNSGSSTARGDSSSSVGASGSNSGSVSPRISIGNGKTKTSTSTPQSILAVTSNLLHLLSSDVVPTSTSHSNTNTGTGTLPDSNSHTNTLTALMSSVPGVKGTEFQSTVLCLLSPTTTPRGPSPVITSKEAKNVCFQFLTAHVLSTVSVAPTDCLKLQDKLFDLFLSNITHRSVSSTIFSFSIFFVRHLINILIFLIFLTLSAQHLFFSPLNLHHFNLLYATFSLFDIVTGR